ncbi:unnamed protein product [Paramecium sonneborni]|uniref:Uncharacterized protein n=1 Tax=Paramecium sonneborni TaxID=65129 RepID=A0A8S1LBQ9_9CILI|nr:unnamed protein product [Paramecium sonneborni]
MSNTPQNSSIPTIDSKKKSKLKEIQAKMKQKMLFSGTQSISQNNTRFSVLENKLGLRALSRSDRFDVVLKEFKGLDTFFTINELLQELNTAGVDDRKNEIQRDKIKILLEQEKIKRWKTQFPQHLEFESNTRFSVKSDLLLRARNQLNLEKYEPQLFETIQNLKPYLKEKFKNIDLRENPQLQLFKDITDIKQIEKEQKKNIIARLSTNIESMTQILPLKETKNQDYYDTFQSEADKLRIRLREQQMEFFNKKWGNSIVKMKVKDQQFKRQAQNNFKRMQTIQVQNQERKKKAARETITDPFMKELISDVCYEEAEMMEEKKEIQQIFRQMQLTHDCFYKKYEDPEVIGLRMITK